MARQSRGYRNLYHLGDELGNFERSMDSMIQRVNLSVNELKVVRLLSQQQTRIEAFVLIHVENTRTKEQC